MTHHDPQWMHATLALHILCGSLAFVLAPVALITAKGGKAHRRWGLVYFYAMAGVAVSAIVMAAYRPVLLALAAIFSFYNAWLAYRVLGQKAAYRGDRVVRPLDWFAAGCTFLASLLLAACGIFRPALIQNLSIPAILFGGLGIRLAGRALWGFSHRPGEKMFWWYEHLQGMLGSYIAAWTAFLVVAVDPRLHWGVILWVLPSATPAFSDWRSGDRPHHGSLQEKVCTGRYTISRCPDCKARSHPPQSTTPALLWFKPVSAVLKWNIPANQWESYPASY